MFVAVDYTSLARAWMLKNAHSVLIVLMAAASRKHLTRGERLGASVAVAGVVVMQLPAVVGTRSGRAIAGDFVALASSVAGIMYLEWSGRLRQRVPLFLFIAPMSSLSAALFALVAHVLQGTDLSISDSGAFGWLAPNRLLYGLYLGAVVGLLGNVACIAALSHMPPVVVSVAQTLVPPMGTFLTVATGLDSPPGGFTLAGTLTMVLGVLLIARGSSTKQVRVDLNPSEETV